MQGDRHTELVLALVRQRANWLRERLLEHEHERIFVHLYFIPLLVFPVRSERPYSVTTHIFWPPSPGLSLLQTTAAKKTYPDDLELLTVNGPLS